MSDKVKYTYWENVGAKTKVLSSNHPNINMWFLAGSVVSLTDTEVAKFNIKEAKDIKETTDKEKIKKAKRPNQARQELITGKFGKSDEEKKKALDKANEADSFAPTKDTPLDPITKQPVTA